MLIVIGFVQLSNRDRSQSLSQQLSLEAYYAAESGINEVKALLAKGSPIPSKSSCAPNNTYIQKINGSGSIGNVGISCLLVQTSENVLSYGSISPGNYRVINVATSNGFPLNKLEVYWQNPNVTSNTIPKTCFGNSSSPILVPSLNSSSCYSGMLELSIVPSNNLTNVKTVYLYDGNGPAYSQINFLSVASGSTYNGNCSTSNSPDYCFQEVQLPTGVSNWYLMVKPIYIPSKLDILGFTGSNQAALTGQVIVDSTGYAGNEVQRLRVNLSDNSSQSNNTVPTDSIDSTNSICKIFEYNNANPISSNLCNGF